MGVAERFKVSTQVGSQATFLAVHAGFVFPNVAFRCLYYPLNSDFRSPDENYGTLVETDPRFWSPVKY
jgi:hypothetical protein